MRVSASPNHADYKPELIGNVTVLLDGKPVEHLCDYANEEDGFVILQKIDANGDPVIKYGHLDGHGYLEFERVDGKVEIIPREAS